MYLMYNNFFEGSTNIDTVYETFIQLIRKDYMRGYYGEEKRNKCVKGCG